MGIAFTALASYAPAEVVSNATLAPEVGWTADEIYRKTGIAERRVAGQTEFVSDLAVQAAERVFAARPELREAIDFLILCTQTPDYLLPSTSCLVHRRLKLRADCGAFDLNQGCSGYVYSLSVAAGMIASGAGRCGLVLTGDTYSKLLHREDRAVRTIFGDGATATVVQASAGGSWPAFVFGTDGAGADNLIVRHSGLRALAASPGGAAPRLEMNGPEIFAFTLKAVPALMTSLLARAGLQLADVDWFVFHQANAFMLKHLQEKIGVPASRMLMRMQDTGNTVSSTIPIVLEDAMERKLFKPGERIALVGFGVGYSWAGCILTWA